MLERFAFAAADDGFAERVGFSGGQGALEIQVEIHARHLEEVGQEQLGLQARGFDAAFGQKIGALLYRFQDGHGRKLCFSCPAKKEKVLDTDFTDYHGLTKF